MTARDRIGTGVLTGRSGLGILAGLCVACLLTACAADEWGDANPRAGPALAPLPGIARVAGACSGRIALTPTETSKDHPTLSYPVVYDCAARKFVVLEPAGSRDDQRDYADLNFTPGGYYMNEYWRVGRQRHGGYDFYKWSGVRVGRLERSELDPHDLVASGDSLLYMKYTTPRAVADGRHACGTFPIELEIVEETAGRVTWSWSSAGHLDPDWKVMSPALDEPLPDSRWERTIDLARHCYTGLLKRIASIPTPSAYLVSDGAPLFRVRTDDYIHANSIARVGSQGDVLVSARHLDSIFLVERATGTVKWSLSGPKGRMSTRKPLGDPRGGFSHQHSAYIEDNNLYVFDNGNNFPGEPSRAVIYEVDASRLDSATFKFEFKEPNGLLRPSAGNVQALGGGRILIGWGGVGAKDENRATRAVSIVDTNTGKEEFSIDFAPGWESYRARHAPAK